MWKIILILLQRFIKCHNWIILFCAKKNQKISACFTWQKGGELFKLSKQRFRRGCFRCRKLHKNEEHLNESLNELSLREIMQCSRHQATFSASNVYKKQCLQRLRSFSAGKSDNLFAHVIHTETDAVVCFLKV